MTLELTDLEARALRSAIQWAVMLNGDGKIELFEYQLEAYDRLLPELAVKSDD